MSVLVRPLDRLLGRAAPDEVDLVARRMRATLEEVLGEARGREMYTLDWLRDRVRQHLDPAVYVGEVFLAERAGAVCGHTIVRLEPERGLISTIYVLPAARGQGVAGRLLDRAEAWFREHGAEVVATNTAQDNARLIGLLERRGYAIALRAEEMVRLERRLEPPPPPA
ncbi:MAG: GNAT family N-acetyltransferase [Planctomycetota bacterium]